jgi:hypothetical protein
MLWTLPQAVVYLIGVIVLFRLFVKGQKECKTELNTLIERYHTLVSEQVRTLTIIAEHLEEEEVGKK